MSFEDAEILEFNLYRQSDKAPFIIYADLESLTLCRIGGGAKKSPLPVFPLQLLQTSELSTKTFRLLFLTLFPH